MWMTAIEQCYNIAMFWQFVFFVKYVLMAKESVSWSYIHSSVYKIFWSFLIAHDTF
jgi:hypothetical protein